MSDVLQNLSQEMIPAVEQEMKRVCRLENTTPDLFHGMIHYHMGWVDSDLQPVNLNGGKRIRPLLLLLTCQAAGGDWRQALPAAAAVELLHNFTLIHDDIQDASPTRRGRPTLWQLWGVPQAINSGDALFAFSHLAMAGLQQRSVKEGIVVEAIRRMDEMCIDLTHGQFADMRFETRSLCSVAEYVAMITGKTAVLLSLCTALGALIAGSETAVIDHYAAFGRDLGLAFQIRDDILGIWGEESLIGKSAATDIETKKKSLPVLFGLNQNEELRALYAQEPTPADFVPRVVALLDQAGAHAFAEEKESRYADNAINHLDAAGGTGECALALRQLTTRLLNRQA
jgi:geranylgeranyl diphosphate synthase, type I